VVAPLLHMVKGDLARRLEDVADRGGSVVTTFLSGRVDEDDNAFLMDVPGPLGPLTGVRVDEWDARGPEVVNPVRLRDGDSGGDRVVEVGSRLFFEIVIPDGAEVVGTYGADFYAGTPAVTRNAFGSGQGWYVAAGLDQQGVSWVMRRVLERHGIELRYPDNRDLETAMRIAPDGSRVLFILNHRAAPTYVTVDHAGTDLLAEQHVDAGDTVKIDGCGVMIIREDA